MKKENFYFYIPTKKECNDFQSPSYRLAALYLEKDLINSNIGNYRYFDRVDYELHEVGRTTKQKLSVTTGDDIGIYHTAKSFDDLLKYFDKQGGRQVSKKEYLKARRNATKIHSLHSLEKMINQLSTLFFCAGILYTIFAAITYYKFKL